MYMCLACLMCSVAQQAAQYKEEILLAKNNLDDAQRKLQSYTFLEKQKTETIQELQRELQKLQKDSLIAGEELAPNRYHQVTSRERLSCEPVWTLQQLPSNGIASPMQPAHNLPTQTLKSVFLWLPFALGNG